MNRLQFALGVLAMSCSRSAFTGSVRARAIQRLVDTFQAAIIAKDSSTLRGLFLEPSSWAQVDAAPAGSATLMAGSYRELHCDRQAALSGEILQSAR